MVLISVHGTRTIVTAKATVSLSFRDDSGPLFVDEMRTIIEAKAPFREYTGPQ